MKEFIERLKKKVVRYLIVASVIIAIIIWPGIIFYPMGALLYRNDHPLDHADAVWLLMGEVAVRPAAAAKAVLSKTADRLVFVTSEMSPVEQEGLMPSEEQLTLKILKAYGLEDSNISVISEFGRVSSTAEEAVAMKKMLIAPNGQALKRIVVVTSWPHSARAGWIIEKALSGTGVTIELLPVDAIPYDKTNWWKTERGLIFVFEEYIKWGRYLIKYLWRDI